MEGAVVKEKIITKGYTLREVAAAIGESPQNFHAYMKSPDVRSGFLERIGEFLGEPVSYFYNEYPILRMEDYAHVRMLEQEVTLLRQRVEEQQKIINTLLKE